MEHTHPRAGLHLLILDASLEFVQSSRLKSDSPDSCSQGILEGDSSKNRVLADVNINAELTLSYVSPKPNVKCSLTDTA